LIRASFVAATSQKSVFGHLILKMADERVDIYNVQSCKNAQKGEKRQKFHGEFGKIAY